MNRWVEKYDAQSFRLKDGSQSRMLASIMLFTCGMQLAMSFFVSPDMLFAMWIVAALYTFWRLIMDQGSYGLSKDIKKRKHLQWRFGLYVFCKDNLSDFDILKTLRYVRSLQRGHERHYNTLFLSEISTLHVCRLDDGIRKDERIVSMDIDPDLRRKLFLESIKY